MSPKSTEVLMVEINNLKEDFTELKTLLKEHMAHEEAQMERLLQKLDDKYASKWTEKFVAWLILMILVGVAGLAGNTILDHAKEEKVVVSK